jgi:hypothetical protein
MIIGTLESRTPECPQGHIQKAHRVGSSTGGTYARSLFMTNSTSGAQSSLFLLKNKEMYLEILVSVEIEIFTRASVMLEMLAVVQLL